MGCGGLSSVCWDGAPSLLLTSLLPVGTSLSCRSARPSTHTHKGLCLNACGRCRWAYQERELPQRLLGGASGGVAGAGDSTLDLGLLWYLKEALLC